MGLLQTFFGDPNKKEIEKIEPVVAIINDLEADLEKISDAELKNKTEDFRKRLSNGETLDNILPEAFAVAREAAKRVIGERHYDVQLIGGYILHQGKIAEMKTGEGKTLVASLPLYLNALEKKGCHLIAPNDYLARVGGGWMGRIYHFLGLSNSVIAHEFSAIYDPNFTDSEDHGDERLNHWRPCTRKEAYEADITYGTNNEFGFDYLRDNMAWDITQLSQRDLNFAIVDEVDSILIDEARTPLIISAPAEESASFYQQFSQIVKRLKPVEDFALDEKDRAVSINNSGIEKVEKLLNTKELYSPQNVHLVHYLEEALKAEFLFTKNKDYVSKDGEIIIVDEFTGRLMQGRRYSEGLHQAIEAKEGVEVKRESNTLATITFQNLFRMYKKLSGMTGTASTEAEEFYKIYKLEVVEIPTHRPVARIDINDSIFKSRSAKLTAIIEDIKQASENGQPVLVGTISIEKNEELSKLLKREGIKFELLNAKQHENEAKIISNAGKPGAVTVATNMAGRGVDILLGGVPPKKDDKEKWKKWEDDRQKVLDAGGLYVIGTERHEARRIDNQLRGRAGRQGDPGTSKFFVSMEDDLMRIFGGERMKNLMERLGLPDDQPIEHKLISNSLEQAQKKVEGHNFDIRKHLVEYDDIMNKHREVIYRKRRKILEFNPQQDDWLNEEIKSLILEEDIKTIYEKEKSVGIESWRNLEKMVYLRTIDTLWIEHLNTMTQLREGIGLRGYAQHDPLVVYKEEAYHIFQRLVKTIEGEVIEILLNLQIQPNGDARIMPTVQKNLQLEGAEKSAQSGISPVDNSSSNNSGVTFTVRDSSNTQPQTSTNSAYHGVGRNDQCPCGSGKKFKKCHGK